MEVRLSLSRKETDVKEVAPAKASLPMEVRPLGKETEAKEVAPLKALSSIRVRLSGKETDSKPTVR